MNHFDVPVIILYLYNYRYCFIHLFCLFYDNLYAALAVACLYVWCLVSPCT